MKKIITHINPDTDAIISVWLIKKFLPASPAGGPALPAVSAARQAGGPGWSQSKIEFAEANEATARRAQVNDPDILFVDVGRDKLDHHQSGRITSAAQLCWKYIKTSRKNQPLGAIEKEAVKRLVAVETEIDNARDLAWPEAGQDRTVFYFHFLIDGLRGMAETDEQVMTVGLRLMDAAFWHLKNKIKARSELGKGIQFGTPWGKGIALETGNKQVLWEGEVAGFAVVVKKDPQKGGVQIYSRWDSDADLTRVYNKIKFMDSEADWFLHASKKLLLNQASVNKKMRPTRLSLEQLIEIFKSYKL